MKATQDLTLSSDELDFLSLIIENPSFLDITIIKPEYLSDKNKIMFKILLFDHKTNKEINVSNLSRFKEFDLDYYSDILTNEVFYTNIDNKFKELEKSIITNYKINQAKQSINESIDFETLYKKINELNEINILENEYINTKDMVSELVNKKTKVELKFPQLDSILNLSQGDLLILAGGTGTGKTAFALNLLSKLSNNYQCIYFNMEMSKNILYRRLLAIETNITLMDLNDITKLSKETKINIKNQMDNIEQRKIILINKSLTIYEIRNTIAKIKPEKPLIVFLDHIGLIKSNGNSIYERMTNIAKELRSISMNYSCTVIGLCQLSRESQKNDSVPKLQDLRDSGEIEQSARKVIMLHNKDTKSKNREHNMEIIIAKNDDGSQNVIKEFTFDRYTQKFNEKYY